MKKIIRKFYIAVSFMILIPIFAVVSHAEDAWVDVYVRGVGFERSVCVMRDGVTRVPFRAFCYEMTDGEAVVEWDDATGTASAKWHSLEITARVGEPYIIANRRYLWCEVDNYAEDGVMMVAVRPLAKAFGAEVEWRGDINRASVKGNASPIEPGEIFYDGDDLYWLSRIISAESRGEPLLGKIAVGTVVYNRVAAKQYPDNIHDVIFDTKNGVQFSPAKSGSVYNDPTDESVLAAKLCMDGARVGGESLYFCTTEIMYTSWAGRNRPYVMTIGNHAFFA